MREQLVRLCEIYPVEFIVRNIATGSLTKRLGIPDGTILSKPLVEFSYKNDDLGDPVVSKEHILEFGWIKSELEFDQLILEFYKKGEPNSGWVHCSYSRNQNRQQCLIAYREDGKVKYKPW